MDIIETIREFVEAECKKPGAKYDYGAYKYHFTSVARYASKLADVLGGDKEVIMIAAWLHDIGSIVKGRADHHESGAKIAEWKLRELGYPDDKVELVKKCILNHRGSRSDERLSLEERIVTEADALSQFDNLGGIFHAAFIEGLDQKQAEESVLRKLNNKYNQLTLDASKKLIRPKIEAARTLLGNKLVN